MKMRIKQRKTKSIVCELDIGLNLCIVFIMSCMVAISEDDLVTSYKERSKACCH